MKASGGGKRAISPNGNDNEVGTGPKPKRMPSLRYITVHADANADDHIGIHPVHPYFSLSPSHEAR